MQINEIPKPTVYDTAVVRLPLWVWKMTAGRFLGSKQPLRDDAEDGDEKDAAILGATAQNPAGEARRRRAKARQRA